MRRSTDEILRDVARTHNIPEEMVLAEIEKAIEEAMQNPDPAIRKNWKKMPWKGRKPSAVEFIEYLSELLRK